ACLNIGGIANISYDSDQQRIAFDICPANMLLNYFAKQMGKDYDKNGCIAKSGNINGELLQLLNSLGYYKISPPKSTGREYIFDKVIPIVEMINAPVTDKLRTLTEHIAYQIAKTMNEAEIITALFTGGGTRNLFLLELIRERSHKQIIIPEGQIIDFKEALIFAFLGVLRIENKTNCLSSVTGASTNSCSGAIFQA
ncbi:MAG: anhydro-N-acetylmuramic acid kinase, partial [Bacteroidales bacterium]|nr:anhydro-N-acetylmuramic acid kinase [Bacteroidales bacterium]